MGRLEAAREGYDPLIGLEASDERVDGCLTKAPCGARFPAQTQRTEGELRIKDSTLVDAGGLPVGVVSAPANRHDPHAAGTSVGPTQRPGPTV